MTFHRKQVLLAALAALAALPAAACGIKPDHVAPPAGAEDTIFPRTYPNTATDPGPGDGSL